MTGKFLRLGAIADTIKSDEQMNVQQKRAGKTRYHADVVSCDCGKWALRPKNMKRDAILVGATTRN
ncbi:hypothetical protein ACC672_37250, partial [Rhizobium ruizarguesonis]